MGAYICKTGFHFLKWLSMGPRSSLHNGIHAPTTGGGRPSWSGAGERGEYGVKRRTRIALSVVSGVAAAIAALLYASSVQTEAQKAQQEALSRYGGEVVSVCVATRDIDPGDVLDESCVAAEEWLASLLPSDAVTSLDDVLGKTATSHIPHRAPLSAAYFEKDENAIEVPSGKVAVSVSSDPEHAVGGALVRNAVVDVYVSRDSIADRLVRARVLDTSSLANGGGDIAWVTLAVDPASVSELLAATTQGAVTLVVPGDTERDAQGGGA